MPGTVAAVCQTLVGHTGLDRGRVFYVVVRLKPVSPVLTDKRNRRETEGVVFREVIAFGIHAE